MTATIMAGEVSREISAGTSVEELPDLLGVDNELVVRDSESGEIIEGELEEGKDYQVHENVEGY